MASESKGATRILLYGPKGCGKTAFASACFNETAESDSGFMTIKLVASEILADPVTNLGAAFKGIERFGVKNLLVEDIDELISNLKSQNPGYSQLLLERITGAHSLKLIIATARDPETMPVRVLDLFTDILPILYPDEKARLEILEIHTRGLKVETSVNLKVVAQETQWWSGGEIQEMIQRSKSEDALISATALSQNIDLLSQRINSAMRIKRMQELLSFTRTHCNNNQIRDQLLTSYGVLLDKSWNKESIESSDRLGENTLLMHPNMHVLINRLDDSLIRNDYASVLHASASIFETLAKDIVRIPTVQDKTLKSFFERYRQDSNLPDEILDYILGIYELRNTTPLAGHGSTRTPSITREAAVTLSEMTKAFVKIEYTLRKDNQ